MSNIVKYSYVNVGDPFVIKDPEKKEQVEEDNPELEKISELLKQSEQKAEKIVIEATAQADKIIAAANKKAQGIEDQARQKGYDSGFEQGSNDGYNAGYDQGMKDIQGKADELLDESRQLCQLAQEEFNGALQKAEPEIINIVLTACANIIGDEIETRPDKVSSIIRKVLTENNTTESVVVKVSPEDYDAVTENLDTILKYSAYSGKVDIKKDVALSEGDFSVETPIGNVDAGVKVQLELLERTFKNLLV